MKHYVLQGANTMTVTNTVNSSGYRSKGVVDGYRHATRQKGGHYTMRGVKVLLVGESKTGKSLSLDTLPRGLVDFSWDIGGWRPFARTRDTARAPREGEEELWLTDKGNPVTVTRSLKVWLEKADRPLLPRERLVVDYATADPITMGQYTGNDAVLMTGFFNDFNCLWGQQKECVERGVCHVSMDSLTSYQRPMMEYVKAMNARVITVVQDWGQAIDKIDESIQSGVALPFDFIMTAHTQPEKDELQGVVREQLLIYGKSLPATLLAKFDDIFRSLAERTQSGMKYSWGTDRSGPLQVYIPKGMEKGAPDAQTWPYMGVPVGTRNFTGLAPRVPQDFVALYGDKLFNV